ncbi:MAG TPA: branched-chain amino acid ABC transporter permease, partial [Acidimicrobiales bacterium]|nr:branched-chain amino acid ABC transporter permease [Acidimicrobiales bacterium]
MAALAVMTGPEGATSYALSGFSGSLLHPRVVIFAVMAVVLWSLMTFYQRVRIEVRSVSDWVGALPSRVMPNLWVRVPVYLALLAGAILVPITLNPFWQEVLVDQIGVYVLLALGLNVVVGFAGLLDLGYVAFYAIGAYSCAFWTGKLPFHPFAINPFYAIPLAILAAMLAGVLLGLPTLRLRGDYLAIVTLGFGGIIEIVAGNWYGLTNGAFGVLNIPHFSVHLLGVHYTWGGSELPYYYLLLAFVVIAIVAYSSLDNSRIGRAWAAIREDEVAASATGINVLKYKVMAFAIGAATSGFAGMITASKISYISPGSFVVQISILVLVLVIFGGMGSIVGAMIGAAFLQWFPWFLRVHPLFGFQQEDVFIYFGALLIVMMIFRPQGVIPSKRRRREIGLAEHGIGSADALDETAPGAR